MFELLAKFYPTLISNELMWRNQSLRMLCSARKWKTEIWIWMETTSSKKHQSGLRNCRRLDEIFMKRNRDVNHWYISNNVRKERDENGTENLLFSVFTSHSTFKHFPVHFIAGLIWRRLCCTWNTTKRRISIRTSWNDNTTHWMIAKNWFGFKRQ